MIIIHCCRVYGLFPELVGHVLPRESRAIICIHRFASHRIVLGALDSGRGLCRPVIVQKCLASDLV